MDKKVILAGFLLVGFSGLFASEQNVNEYNTPEVQVIAEELMVVPSKLSSARSLAIKRADDYSLGCEEISRKLRSWHDFYPLSTPVTHWGKHDKAKIVIESLEKAQGYLQQYREYMLCKTEELHRDEINLNLRRQMLRISQYKNSLGVTLNFIKNNRKIDFNTDDIFDKIED